LTDYLGNKIFIIPHSCRCPYYPRRNREGGSRDTDAMRRTFDLLLLLAVTATLTHFSGLSPTTEAAAQEPVLAVGVVDNLKLTLAEIRIVDRPPRSLSEVYLTVALEITDGGAVSVPGRFCSHVQPASVFQFTLADESGRRYDFSYPQIDIMSVHPHYSHQITAASPLDQLVPVKAMLGGCSKSTLEWLEQAYKDGTLSCEVRASKLSKDLLASTSLRLIDGPTPEPHSGRVPIEPRG
jgi:hypothetical protein